MSNTFDPAMFALRNCYVLERKGEAFFELLEQQAFSPDKFHQIVIQHPIARMAKTVVVAHPMENDQSAEFQVFTAEIPVANLAKLIQMAEKISLRPFVLANQEPYGRDGSSYELTIGVAFNQATFAWWDAGTRHTEWEALVEFCSTFRALVEKVDFIESYRYKATFNTESGKNHKEMVVEIDRM
jgi:hypothetical protein